MRSVAARSAVGSGQEPVEVRTCGQSKGGKMDSITGLYRQSLQTVTAPIGPRVYRVQCQVCGWAVEGMAWKWAVEAAEGHEAGHAGGGQGSPNGRPPE